jgi:hypothetical protein
MQCEQNMNMLRSDGLLTHIISKHLEMSPMKINDMLRSVRKLIRASRRCKTPMVATHEMLHPSITAHKLFCSISVKAINTCSFHPSNQHIFCRRSNQNEGSQETPAGTRSLKQNRPKTGHHNNYPRLDSILIQSNPILTTISNCLLR